MGKLNRIKHSTRFFIILILVFYFGIIAFLNVPFIQKQLSAYATRELSQLFQTEVSIGNINLGLLNRIIIQNVSLKDREGEEMLKISRFSAKFDISPLLHGQIRISSIQLFGLNAQLKKETPESKPNFQFIIDTFAPKDTVKKENNIDLRINTILIRRGQLAYDVRSEEQTPGKFNPSHIKIKNLSATLALKTLQKDSLNAQIRRMSFSEQSGFQLKRFSAKLAANNKGVQLANFSIGLPDTEIVIDTLAASAEDMSKPFSIENPITYQGNINASVTLADLSPFVPAFRHFKEPLTLQLAIEGKGKHIRCTNFSLSDVRHLLRIKAEAMVNAEGASRPPYLFGKISQAAFSEQGIGWLFRNLTGKDEMPNVLKQVEFLDFEGDVSGFMHQLTVYGNFRSAIGSLKANVTMHKDTITNLNSYSGKILSEDFNIGKLLNKENTLGKAAFDIELKGLRYQNDRPESYVKGVISSLEYNQYNYQNILLDGQYQPGGFQGKIALNDENGTIEVNGQFVTKQQTPDFNLRAIVRNLRPNNLNLTQKYQDTDISLNLTADFSGHSVDDMKGEINLDSLSVDAPDNERDYFLQNLNITAGNTDGEKEIRIHSPFMRGTVKGNYSYRSIWASIQRVIRQYLPSILPEKAQTDTPNNNFNFDLYVENSDFASKVFDIPLTLKMPATIKGYFNDSLARMGINAYFPQFSYNGKEYESGNIICENPSNELQCRVRVGTLMKKGAMFNFTLHTRAKNDHLQTTLYWGNNTNITYSGKVDAVAGFSKMENTKQLLTKIDLRPSQIVLNDTVWNVHPATITVAKDSIEIQNFLFEHADQHLKANGRIGKKASDSCLVDLRNINLLYIMDMIQFHAVKFYGLISGKVHLHHVMDDPVIQARLDVGNFSLNDALLGQADITGSWDKEIGGIRLLADIRENESRFTRVNGYVSPKLKGLDLHIQAGGTDMSFLQPFIKNIFSDVRGRAYGNVRLFGPFSGLDLEGSVQANMGMKVNILNTRFEASADSVRITSGNFHFENVQLNDPEGHLGTANGELHHTKLKNLSYQFRFDMNNMLVYNTARETPDFPFYGRIYTTGNVRLRGGDNMLNVDGTLRADNRTTFAYVLGGTSEAVSNQFITFVDRTPRRQQEDIETEVYHYLNQPDKKDEDDTPADVRINLQIEPTEQANMKIIMDPLAGDNISAKGTGNLRINFFNKGDFQIFGTYNIAEGIYKMSMQNVIRKDFVLQPGGTVSFNGNPREANLDVQAVYTVNSASLNDLIADAASSRGNVRVNCLLNLTGNLTSPNLKFDLELPTVNEEDRELVRSLTSTEEQMNTQIIYLLGVGKFYTYDYANNSTQSDATSSLAFSTLSGQLNNMLSQVINNGNWNVGTNLSTGEKGWSDVEAEAILSGRLLNNRLIINGNFGYRENTMRNTNFVGDFEAIWLLTKNGDLRLRGYNQTNDRYFTKSTLTTQGIGLMYKKDFTNWKELVDQFLHRRRLRTSKKKKEDEMNYEKSQKEALPAAQKKRTKKE